MGQHQGSILGPNLFITFNPNLPFNPNLCTTFNPNLPINDYQDCPRFADDSYLHACEQTFFKATNFLRLNIITLFFSFTSKTWKQTVSEKSLGIAIDIEIDIQRSYYIITESEIFECPHLKFSSQLFFKEDVMLIFLKVLEKEPLITLV